jgi:hypothetical protein
MFQLIDEYDLKCKETYKIVANYEYKARFKRDVYLSEHFYQIDELYLEFDHAYNLTTKTPCDPVFFLPTRKFYRFVSQKARIQSDMEHRAVNLIIRRLIGDDHFEW